jgi:excisionase family DNA binding protein
MPPPKLMTVKAVADHLQVSTRTVATLLKAGAFPFTRVGRQVRIAEADLAAYIRDRTTCSSSSHRRRAQKSGASVAPSMDAAWTRLQARLTERSPRASSQSAKPSLTVITSPG